MSVKAGLHFSLTHYIPLKWARFSLKTYTLCECGSGYIWKSMLHTTTASMDLDVATDGLVLELFCCCLMKDSFDKDYCVLRWTSILRLPCSDSCCFSARRTQWGQWEPDEKKHASWSQKTNCKRQHSSGVVQQSSRRTHCVSLAGTFRASYHRMHGKQCRRTRRCRVCCASSRPDGKILRKETR